MTNLNYTPERIKGKHLTLKERIEIEKALSHPEKSKRQIARELGVSPQTIINEIKRGTVSQTKKVNGKSIYFNVYSAEASQEAYYKARRNNSNASKLDKCRNFINYCIQKIKKDKNSVDEVVGRTKLLKVFNKDEMVSTKTIYNYIDAKLIEVKNIELPEKVGRKKKKTKKDTRAVISGKSIIERPESVETREEFGHFEADTVIGKKGTENVLLVLTERKTRYQINIMIDSKTADSVEYGIAKIISKFGAKVFKSITVDNGKEFSSLSKYLENTCEVYYCRPYKASDRATNENQNKLIRKFIPKGFSLDLVTRSTVIEITKCMNNKARKILGYFTAEEAFKKEVKSY